MPSSPLRIAIIGWGMAGPALALALARRGQRVTAFERVEDSRPVGAGILIQPTGMQALADLGVLEEVGRSAAPVRRLFGRTAARGRGTGRTVMDIAYADRAPGLYGLGVHRGTIFQALAPRALAAGVELRSGVEVEELRSRPSGLRPYGEGQELGEFDLVVCADGARSRLRGQGLLPRRVDAFPFGALWALLPDPNAVFGDHLHQVYNGTGTMLGFLPTGRGPDGGEALNSLFWSVKLSEVEALRARGIEAFKAGVLELEPAAAPLLAHLHTIDELLLAPYFDVRMPRLTGMVGGAGLAFIGDAGHAMSPQLGQGTNLALMDALALAEALSAAPLPEALQAFEQRRRAHLRYYQFASRWLTPVFQSRLTWLGPPRDLLFHPFSQLPWVRGRVLDSLVGLADGLFHSQRLEEVPAWKSLPLSVAPDPPGV